MTIAVLDQAFGAPSRLDALAGSELPPIDRQHRLTFDQTYGLAGRDYNGNTSRHGEFVTEIAYDMAPVATYWFLNYHTPDEFGLAADYIANVLRPDIVIHSNSFLFGPFDGSGWFARKVDAAAAAGVLWVNSAGNYRTGTGRARGATPTPTATSTSPATATPSPSRWWRRTGPRATSPGRARPAIPAATTASRCSRPRADDARTPPLTRRRSSRTA